MSSRSNWGISPRDSVRRACTLRGEKDVIAGCVALLEGRRVDPQLIHELGGPPARWAVDGGSSGPDYWLKVWGARGLLYAWDDTAASIIVNALSDDAWRVREMAAKVCARHRVEEAVQPLALLSDDPNDRVRRAAERAVIRITGG